MAATALAAALAVALGGCGSLGPLSVSVLNLATTPIEVQVTPRVGERGDEAPGVVPQTQMIKIGEEWFFVFDQAPSDAAVTVRALIPDSGFVPQVITMAPPGPYLVEVRGNVNGVAIRRAERSGIPDAERAIPRDPYRDGFNADRGPINPGL